MDLRRASRDAGNALEAMTLRSVDTVHWQTQLLGVATTDNVVATPRVHDQPGASKGPGDQNGRVGSGSVGVFVVVV